MKTNYAFLLIVFVFMGFSCKKDEKKKPDLPDISVVDISQESEWDYWVAGHDDNYFVKSENSKPTIVQFYSKQANKDFTVFFSSDGLPQKIVVESYIYLLDNFDGNNVDIGVIYPDGTIEILRQVASSANWNILKNYAASEEWSDVIRFTGRAVSGIPCALGVAATVASSGVGWPLAAFTCGNYLLGLSADIAENEYGIQNGFTEFVDLYGNFDTYYGCISDFGASCLTDFAATALGNVADHVEELENRAEDVSTAEAALYAGYGDVQVTLTWSNEADLDLHVIDPDGEEIFWSHPGSASGGILDYDDIDGYGPENIYWPESSAPDGDYYVYVHHYPWEEKPMTSSYTLLINAFGHIQKFTGSISYDEVNFIASYSPSGITMQKDNYLKIATETKKTIIFSDK